MIAPIKVVMNAVNSKSTYTAGCVDYRQIDFADCIFLFCSHVDFNSMKGSTIQIYDKFNWLMEV